MQRIKNTYIDFRDLIPFDTNNETGIQTLHHKGEVFAKLIATGHPMSPLELELVSSDIMCDALINLLFVSRHCFNNECYVEINNLCYLKEDFIYFDNEPIIKFAGWIKDHANSKIEFEILDLDGVAHFWCELSSVAVKDYKCL